MFLEGTSEPLGWISGEHLPLVTSELTGVLVSGGKYTLNVLCPLGVDNQGVRPSRPLGIKTVPIQIEDDPRPEEEYLPARSRPGLCLEVVNGWQSKIKSCKATPGDVDRWKAMAGSKAVIRPTTFVRAGVPEPAVAVYLDGHRDQFGWIAKAYVPSVREEMHGYLARRGEYTLGFVCDQPEQGDRS